MSDIADTVKCISQTILIILRVSKKILLLKVDGIAESISLLMETDYSLFIALFLVL